MAILPFFRLIVFAFNTLFSLVVLGICAHILFLAYGYMDIYLFFAPLGIGVACLTVVSLPFLLLVGNLRRGAFTSMILFEIIWFFFLWVLWIATAGDSSFGNSYHFPAGCIYNDYPETNQICFEFTVVEAFAFLNFFCAFVYYDVILLYAIINAVRGQSIWIMSVKEAATRQPAAPMVQSQFNTVPQNYGAYPPQVVPQGPPAQPYQGYPQQVVPHGPVSQQQYDPYAQQSIAYGSPTLPPGQNQPYNYPPGTPQQQVAFSAYSPSQTTGSPPLPPQSNFNSHPISGSQAQLPLPSGYQEQQVPQQQSPPQSSYGVHHSIPV